MANLTDSGLAGIGKSTCSAEANCSAVDCVFDHHAVCSAVDVVAVGTTTAKSR